MDKRLKADPRLTKNATGKNKNLEGADEEDENLPIKINDMLKNVQAMQ